MNYVNSLKNHYENQFKVVANPIMDEYEREIFTIKFIIYGSYAKNKLSEIEQIIRVFYQTVILQDEEGGDTRWSAEYNTSKYTKSTFGEINERNADKLLSYIRVKELGAFSISKHKLLEGLSITNEKRYGVCYAQIEYTNYTCLLKNKECTTYNIEITFPYYKYLSFPDAKKNWLQDFMKASFCNLDAISAVATYYRNFHHNIHFSSLLFNDYVKTDGSKLFGIHWCNMLSEKQVTILEGIEKIKKAVNDKCIIEEHKTQSGENAVFIQLAKKDTDLHKEDLEALKELFVPHMNKISNDKVHKLELRILNMKKGTSAYEAHIRTLNDNLFTCENILFMDDNDIRWL